MCGGGGCRRLELDIVDINVARESADVVIGDCDDDTSEQCLRTANLNVARRGGFTRARESRTRHESGRVVGEIDVC